MKLNKKELKKISYDFLCLSNRLLQADFRDYSTVLSRFIRFITCTDVINDYILDCGRCELNLDSEFKAVQSSRYTFDLGESDEEEVRNITAILQYIVSNNIDVSYRLGFAYSASNKYQDILKAFNDRVVLVLIQHIERYLTKVGIDMGVDENITYIITIKDGQVNIANDNAVINANNMISSNDLEQITGLIHTIMKEASNCAITPENEEILKNSIEMIEEETSSNNPKKSYIKTAIAGLKGIKGTAEFCAAVTALIEFIMPLIG